MLLLLVGACRNGIDENSLAEQREKQYALNVQLLKERLGQIILSDSDQYASDNQLRTYYRDSTNQRIWTENILPTSEADSLVASLRANALRAGFSEHAFNLSQIQEDLDSTRLLNIDSLLPEHIERLARLEYLLSKAYVRFTMGQRYGFMGNPEHVFNHIDVRDRNAEGQPVGYREVMNQKIVQPNSDFVAEAMAKAKQGEAIVFLSESYPKSALYRQLESKLAEITDIETRRCYLANMERARWRNPNMPVDGQRHVLVNVAAQQLWAVGSDTVIQMRVVCGARRTKTPLMQGMLRWIVVNPEWYVPANIVRDEISHHGGDVDYFVRNRYFITNSSRDTIPPEEVTAQQLRANQYRVTQHRGHGNALGRLKFVFNNPYDVFLHDTNQPRAFSYANRALSHGCVRVQRPFDLACFLLQLVNSNEKDRLRTAIGMNPEGEEEHSWLAEHEGDRNARLNRFGNRGITPNVPLYIIYYTVYPNPSDKVLQRWGDPYGYDDQILKAIKPFL